jgi:hypothetical protein
MLAFVKQQLPYGQRMKWLGLGRGYTVVVQHTVHRKNWIIGFPFNLFVTPCRSVYIVCKQQAPWIATAPEG